MPLLLGVFSHGEEADEQQRHGGEDRPALARVAHHAAEGVAQRGGDQEDRQHLQEIGERRGVLERVRRVGVEEAAAVGAQFLDRLLRSDRPQSDDLLLGGRLLCDGIAGSVFHRVTGGIHLRIVVGNRFHCRHGLIGGQVLHHALADQHQSQHGGDAAAGCR